MDVRAFSHKLGVDLDSGRSNLALYVRDLMSYAAKVIANLENLKSFDGCASFSLSAGLFWKYASFQSQVHMTMV